MSTMTHAEISNMSFPEAKAVRAGLEAEVNRTGDNLRGFPKTGPMGMTSDSVKGTPEWKAAKQAYDRAFAKLRAFNGVFVKAFAAELRADRNQRRRSRSGMTKQLKNKLLK